MAKDGKTKAAETNVADVSPQGPLTDDQIEEIELLVKNGGGVTFDNILAGLDYAGAGPAAKDLESYLMGRIALGWMQRLWNNEDQDHYYVTTR